MRLWARRSGHRRRRAPAAAGLIRLRPALEARAIVSTPAKTGDSKPAGAAADRRPSAAVDRPGRRRSHASGAESLTGAPRAQGDSAMKKILRAVNGGKDIPQKP